MRLQDLLTELRENILHDRSDQVTGQTDRLWSDETLVRYINEAQSRFARIGLVLRDGSTPDVTQVTLVTGQAEYTLHDSVLGVLSARYSTEEVDLTRLDHPAIGGQPRINDGPLFDPAQAQLLPAGKPLAYTTDEQVALDSEDRRSAVHLRLYPAPTADYAGDIIKLRVVRLPLEPLVPAHLSAQPEIPEIHHIEMLDYAAYLALRIVDHDAGNPARAHEFRSMFEKNVMQARRDAMRKMFAPVGWGFGRNGFAWETR
jgi:hypothetical protein